MFILISYVFIYVRMYIVYVLYVTSRSDMLYIGFLLIMLPYSFFSAICQPLEQWYTEDLVSYSHNRDVVSLVRLD